MINKGKKGQRRGEILVSVEIYVLGDFRILVDGHDAIKKLKSSKKKLALLEYLILNKNKPVSVSNIVDVLWNDEEDVDLENTLKTLVSRVRKDLTDSGLKNAIITKRGAYMWNPEYSEFIDLFVLEDLCNKVALETELTPEARVNFEQIIFIYSDDLLTNSILNAWISPKTFYYQSLYIKTIGHYINLLKSKNQLNDVIRVCKIALEIDQFDSNLNLELMSALLKIGKNKDALTQYQHVTNLHYTHLGVKPSNEILDFYKELIKQECNSEANIEDIYQELKQESLGKGAFVCEYTIFKDIYNLHSRNLKRLGTRMFLVMISIKPMSSSRAISPLEMDKAMRVLLDLLVESLRSGDTISRYSPSQYASILADIDRDDVARRVLERLKTKFYSDPANSKYVFEYNFMALESEE